MIIYLFIILTLRWHIFWVHIFHFLCHRHSHVILKVHYKSIIFLEFIQKIMMILIKVYDNMNNLKIDNIYILLG
jgi:hypothetical protein